MKSVLIQTTIISRTRHLSVKTKTAEPLKYYVKSVRTKVLIKLTIKTNPSSYVISAFSLKIMTIWIQASVRTMKRHKWKWSIARHATRTNCRKMQQLVMEFKKMMRLTKTQAVSRSGIYKWKTSFCSRLKQILIEVLLSRIQSKINLKILDVTATYKYT